MNFAPKSKDISMILKNCGWFCDDFGDWIHFSARECEWLGGEGGVGRDAERTDGFKQVLPSDVNT